VRGPRLMSTPIWSMTHARPPAGLGYAITLGMRHDVLPISELTARDLAAWHELGADALSPNPFAEQELVLPAARAWGVDDVNLLVVREGPDWLAALPVRHAKSWRGVPGDVIAAWRHDYCFLCTPLVRSAGRDEALAMLVRAALAASPAFSLDWFDGDGPLAQPLMAALASAGRVVVVERFERAVLDRRERDDYLERAFSARHRSGYRRKLKQLEQEVGPVTVRDDRDDPQAVERFLELEASGWKGQAGTAMACNPAHAAFFTEMALAFAKSGRFRMLSLVSEDRTIAMRSDVVTGDATFGFKLAFDENLARYSPGIQLEIAGTGSFHSTGLDRADSCTVPENASMNRLWPDRRALVSAVATRRTPRGAAAYLRWAAAGRLLPLRRRLKRPVAGVRGH
jgi:CelD/BcsL family acetyltransferase involved in cellulose biosynthesis